LEKQNFFFVINSTRKGSSDKEREREKEELKLIPISNTSRNSGNLPSLKGPLR
jgi:hypothetical protein